MLCCVSVSYLLSVLPTFDCLTRWTMDWECHVVGLWYVDILFVQDRQCTYNVTMRRVYETIVAAEKQ
jgi:hypothetical protein